MELIVALSRPLPFPQLSAGGKPISFCPVESTDDIPKGAQVYCATAVDPVDATAIAAMPDSIGLISNFGVGTDNIDLTAAKARGITVTNTPVVTEDTADLAFALILAAGRRVGAGERFLRAGNWTAPGVSPSVGVRIHGKTLGLVGFGPIAQAVARRARGFDMTVKYWNRTERPEEAEAVGAEYENDLKSLASQIDFMSVHTALTPQTRGLIGVDVLNAGRDGLVLVNTARGGIVDEIALCDALESGKIAAAGLDVFDGEPKVNPRLLEYENIVLTPHIGSATMACRHNMAERLLGNVISYLENGTVLDPVF